MAGHFVQLVQCSQSKLYKRGCAQHVLCILAGEGSVQQPAPRQLHLAQQAANGSSVQSDQNVAEKIESLSVSSQGPGDCTFDNDDDLIIDGDCESEAQHAEGISRYESTAGDNATMYAASIASSNGTSIAASHLSHQDQNGESNSWLYLPT